MQKPTQMEKNKVKANRDNPIREEIYKDKYLQYTFLQTAVSY